MHTHECSEEVDIANLFFLLVQLIVCMTKHQCLLDVCVCVCVCVCVYMYGTDRISTHRAD